MALNITMSMFPTLNPDVDPCSNYTAAWLWLHSMQPAYIVLICVVGMVGNGLVLCVLCLQRKPCTVADIYLGNLATADLVMVSCLPFWADTIAHGYHWTFGEALCKLVNVAISMNYYCSVLFLVLVSVDRYLALVCPMSPSRLRRAAWAKRICPGIWLLGFLLSFPVLLFRKVSYVSDPGVDACFLAYPHPSWTVQHNLTRNILGFLVPVSVVTYCSRHIIKALKEGQTKKLPGVRAERKATYLVLAVLVVFLISWTPFQMFVFLDTLDYFQLTPGCLWGHFLDIGIQLSTYLAYTNSSVNPFLYVIVGKQFRKRAKEVFKTILNPSLRNQTFMTGNFTSIGRSIDTRRISCNQLEKQIIR